MPQETDSKYGKALREVVSCIQVLIYRREGTPIRDREEVQLDLERRLREIQQYKAKDNLNWRRQLLELAAYAVFSAVTDE